MATIPNKGNRFKIPGPVLTLGFVVLIGIGVVVYMYLSQFAPILLRQSAVNAGLPAQVVPPAFVVVPTVGAPPTGDFDNPNRSWATVSHFMGRPNQASYSLHFVSGEDSSSFNKWGVIIKGLKIGDIDGFTTATGVEVKVFRVSATKVWIGVPDDLPRAESQYGWAIGNKVMGFAVYTGDPKGKYVFWFK